MYNTSTYRPTMSQKLWGSSTMSSHVVISATHYSPKYSVCLYLAIGTNLLSVCSLHEKIITKYLYFREISLNIIIQKFVKNLFYQKYKKYQIMNIWMQINITADRTMNCIILSLLFCNLYTNWVNLYRVVQLK